MATEKKKVVIWVNHWFSTMYRLIEDARLTFAENTDEYEPYFIGTNKLDTCVYKKVCDEFYVEPSDLTGDNYVTWCLKFCEEHNVQIFVPRREMLSIVEHSYEFRHQGVSILAEEGFNKIDIFDDKWETYNVLENDYKCYFNVEQVSTMQKSMKIPMYLRANDVHAFIDNYAELKTKYPNDRVCFKYSRGEGATSFRVIDDRITGIDSLTKGKGLKITYSEALEMLSSVREFDDLLMLPYMEGPEISIDCVPYKDTYIAVPRLKNGRVTTILPAEKFITLAQSFASHYKMIAPFNLQLRKFKGEFNLLEVNTRLSGGSHIVATLPFGRKCSLFGFSLLHLLDIDFELDKDIERSFIKGYSGDVCPVVRVTQIETPILL